MAAKLILTHQTELINYKAVNIKYCNYVCICALSTRHSNHIYLAPLPLACN